MPRAVHSAPTRRSSDLARAPDVEAVPMGGPDPHRHNGRRGLGVLHPVVRRVASLRASAPDHVRREVRDRRDVLHAPQVRPQARSEEHTSELQSPCNLVCPEPSTLPLHDALPILHEHPTWKQYRWVALILTAITVVEVWVYYIPSFVESRLFVPALLIMSAVKFAIVVMFYMHLKYDHKLDRKSTRLNSSHLVISYAPSRPLCPYTTLFRSCTSTRRGSSTDGWP